MNEPLIGLLTVGIIGLVIVFFTEARNLYLYKKEMEHWNEVSDIYIASFSDMTDTINTNARALREMREYVVKHDRMIYIVTTMTDLHSEILKVNPRVRESLESDEVESLKIEDFDPDL